MTNLPDSAVCGEGEDGASIVEYSLLLGLIVIVCLAAINLLGNQISNFFGSFATSL